jgi:SAM-dependent methyltransferase
MSEPEEGLVATVAVEAGTADAAGAAATTGAERPLMGLRYWERRKDLLYYQVVRILAAGLSEGAESVLDVGSHGSPYLEWFEGLPVRTSLDLVEAYRAEGVTSIVSDFLTWQPDRRYDLVLCLQVLEHVPDARSFARKLLASGRIVIISVPYRWRPGKSKNHVQDPVTMGKIAGWFGRRPNYAHLVAEPAMGTERIVCVFEEDPRPWSSLAVRAGKRGFMPAKGIPPFGQQPLTIRQSAKALVVAVRRRIRATWRRLRR